MKCRLFGLIAAISMTIEIATAINPVERIHSQTQANEDGVRKLLSRFSRQFGGMADSNSVAINNAPGGVANSESTAINGGGLAGLFRGGHMRFGSFGGGVSSSNSVVVNNSPGEVTSSNSVVVNNEPGGVTSQELAVVNNGGGNGEIFHRTLEGGVFHEDVLPVRNGIVEGIPAPSLAPVNNGGGGIANSDSNAINNGDEGIANSNSAAINNSPGGIGNSNSAAINNSPGGIGNSISAGVHIAPAGIASSGSVGLNYFSNNGQGSWFRNSFAPQVEIVRVPQYIQIPVPFLVRFPMHIPMPFNHWMFERYGGIANSGSDAVNTGGWGGGWFGNRSMRPFYSRGLDKEIQGGGSEGVAYSDSVAVNNGAGGMANSDSTAINHT